MSLYVPAMQNASYANLIQQSGRDTARSFLDGVRMHNENKHKAKMMENEQERIDIQRQTMENNAKFRDRALDITEGQFAQQAQMFNQAQQSRQDRKKAVKGVLDYKIKDSVAQGKVAEIQDDYTSGWADDENEKRWMFFAKDVNDPEGKRKFFQNISGKERAKAELKRKGVDVDPKLDSSLLDTINDPESLEYLAPYYSSGKDGAGNFLLNSILNQLGQ